jgi:hypothetical protein
MALNGRRYEVDGTRNVNSPTKTILGITGATNIRPYIYDGGLGSSAAPADNAITWFMQRDTTAGTSTAVTPTNVDNGDPVAITAAGQNHTVEPTYTAGAILFHQALNQRGAWKLNLDPFTPLMVPPTAANGIGLYPVHASFTGAVDAHLYFCE